ncbi:lamina-associated polypeptide 2-like [Leptodactylus fuscus]|uniref:lamina-associated polypeptide 2-like n=1 Tax=Leptodactylus fuscus TaxID=238119 RepID=UPI003F4E8A30
MSEYLEDPSVLTKEKLKNELIANKIELPSGDQRKDVYVQLYRQHLTARNRATPDFSSDEEKESTPVRGRGRPPGRKVTKNMDKPAAEGKNEQDILSLSNDALREELLKYGMKPGPIQGSTRRVYELKLLKLKEQQDVPPVTPPVAVLSTADNKQNGNTDAGQYSDNDEPRTDLTLEPREPLRGKPKAQVTSRSKRLEQNEVGDMMDKLTQEERVEIVLISGERNHRVIATDFNARHPTRPPISHTAVGHLLTKFRQTGSVSDMPRSGRKRRATDDETSVAILV